jgi:hypothetical protein
MERRFSLPAIEIFEEYTTNNIKRDGSPVTVKSKNHERELLRDNGLIKADSKIRGG